MPLKKPDDAAINEKLVQARLECNLSQMEVAAKIGTTLVSISRWERGITTPSPYFKKKLCQLYGKTEEDLGLVREDRKSREVPLPREELDTSKQPLRSLWNVPYSQSSFFTGRAGILQDLYDKLRTNHAKISTVAMSGLGGIGKTLIALEYAYRHQRDYSAVFWAKAVDAQTLAADFVKLAGKDVLNLAEKDEPNQDLIVTAVKRWLSTHHGWLLILDNVEDLSVVAPFLPLTGYGSVLLTTRDQASGEIIDDQVKVDTMEPEDAVVLLLRRARILLKDASLDTVGDRDRKDAQAIAAVLDYLPLALDQAGAYIEETQCGLSAYLDLYEKHHQALLERRSRLAIRYRETVTTTWSISFHKVERANSLSADLLRLFAFLHADAIPEELLTACLQESGLLTQHADAAFAFNEALEELMKYSLVNRNANDRTLSIHRLVQTVLQDGMSEDTQRQWAERIIHAVARIFPYVDFFSLQRCERYILHAQTCLQWIERWNIIGADATHLLRDAGIYFQERGQYAHAEAFLQASVTIGEQLLAAQFPELPNSLNCLAILSEKLGKYTEAEHLYQRTLSLCEEVLGPEHPDVISPLNNLAVLYIAQGRLSDAEPFAQRVLNIVGKGKSVNHQDVAHALHTVAELYCAKGEYVLAEPLYQQVVDIREEHLGSEHPEVANALNDLAVLYMHQGRFSDAEPLCQRALSIAENTRGADHPFVAFNLNNLASIAMAQGKFPEAEHLFQRALTIREHALGHEHSEVANSLNNFAVLYEKQGKLEEAAAYLQKALALSEQAKGPDHPEVAVCLTNLAELYMRQQRYDLVEPLCQRALEIIAKVHGGDHPDAIYAYTTLASLYSLQGKLVEAGTLYQQTLAQAQTMLGPEHPQTVVISQYYTDFLRQIEQEVGPKTDANGQR